MNARHYDDINILQIIPAHDHLYAGFGGSKNGKVFITLNKVLCYALIETTSSTEGTSQVIDGIAIDEFGFTTLCKKDDDFLGFRIYPEKNEIEFRMQFSDGSFEYEIPM